MKTIEKEKLSIIKLFSLIFVASVHVFLSSCTASFDQEEEPVQNIRYELDDGTVISVVLDSNYEQQHTLFDSYEQHDEYLQGLENSDEELIVNKRLYEELSHMWDPFQISVLDLNGQISIGEEELKFTKLANYSRSIGSNRWEMDIYYGESGKVDLQETQMIYENLTNLEVLKFYPFLSPAARDIFEQELALSESNTRLMGTDENWIYYKSGNNNVPVYYRTQPSGVLQYVHVRWYVWNKSYTISGGRRRSNGGTVTQVKYVQQSSGWTSLSGDDPIGSYLESGNLDQSLPYVAVQIMAGGKGWKSKEERHEWSIISGAYGRAANKGTKSKHWARLRNDATGSMNTVFSGVEIQ